MRNEPETKDLDFDRKHQEDLQRIRNFRLMDDDFMSKVFEDKTCAEFLLKGGLPIYHVDRTIRENGKEFPDGAHIIFVNSQIKDETALGKLMYDFSCTDPQDMNYPVLAKRVRYFKEDTKGVTTMCKAMEEMRNETALEAKHEKAVEVAESLLAIGQMSYEAIAAVVKLPVEEVKALDHKKSA